MNRDTSSDAARKLLQNMMEQHKWRAPQAAEALGVSEDIVRRWLKGVSRMQLDDVIRIAELADADLNETFGLKKRSAAGGSDSVEFDRMLEQKVRGILLRLLMPSFGLESDVALGTRPAASAYSSSLDEESRKALTEQRFGRARRGKKTG
jgi:transcriptional regulator with XRE-family HTH domain